MAIMVLLPLPGAGIRMLGDVVVTPVDNSFTVALETSPALKAVRRTHDSFFQLYAAARPERELSQMKPSVNYLVS